MRDNADLLPGINEKKYIRFNLTPKLGDPEWYDTQEKGWIRSLAEGASTGVKIAGGVVTRSIKEGWDKFKSWIPEGSKESVNAPVVAPPVTTSRIYAPGQWVELDDYHGMEYYLGLSATYITGPQEAKEIEWCKERLTIHE